MRRAAVAGQFYPSDPKDLRVLINELFLHPLGPGNVPSLRKGPRNIVGGVVPHAGYVFSGPVAAHFYHSLAKDGFPESFIIIGPNHYGVGSGVAVATEDFETPLGRVRVDRELAKSIARDLIDMDDYAHKYEHSIEVQLPFLQFFKKDVKFVPIAMLFQEYEIAVEVGNIIRDAIDGRDVVVIASSDFSHYVPKNVAYSKDALAIEKIIQGDVKGLYEVIEKHNITMCGYGPVAAMLTATRGKATLLKYATSGDVHPMEDVVGYAAIKVER
jgi:AmmeMemoRadiSam system protein B